MFSVTDASLLRRSSQYDQLPECIKQNFTAVEYAWLPDDQKCNLIQTETEPECE